MRTRISRVMLCMLPGFLLLLASCSDNYGKKVGVNGTKGEVYYKGDSITEADAKAVGEYLKQEEFFQQDEKVRSVQISRSKGRVEVRFVIDEKAMSDIPQADKSFAVLGAGMSKAVFHDAPLDVIYTDNAFRDKRKLPFQPELLSQSNPVGDELKALSRIDYANNTLYYTSNIPEADAQRLVAYLKEKQFFIADGSNDLIVRQVTPDSVWLRFPVRGNFANEQGFRMVDEFVKGLKQDIFGSTAVRFDITDPDLKAYKTLHY